MVEEVLETEVETEAEDIEPKLSIREAMEASAEELGTFDDEETGTTSLPKREDKPAPQKPVKQQISKAQKPTEEAKVSSEKPQDDIAPPQFWAAEDKAHFSTLSPEAKKAVLKYEQMRNQYVNRLGGEIANAKKEYAGIEEAFAPVKDQMARHGLTPASAAKRMMAWQTQIEKDPVPVLREFINSWGLKPEDLIQQDGEQVDPRLEELIQKQAQQDEIIRRLEQEKEDQLRGSLDQQVTFFKTEKDQNGNLKRPYVNFFEPQIAAVAKQLRSMYPQANNLQVLQASYDYVMQQHQQHIAPQAQPSVNPQQQQIQAIKEKTQKAKLAGSSISGSPGSGSVKAKPTSIRGHIEEAWNELA